MMDDLTELRQQALASAHKCHLSVYGIVTPHTCRDCGASWQVRDSKWVQIEPPTMVRIIDRLVEAERRVASVITWYVGAKEPSAPEWLRDMIVMRCTGLTAVWCPICGDCCCNDPDLELTPGEREMRDSMVCPLHSPLSLHADGIGPRRPDDPNAG